MNVYVDFFGGKSAINVVDALTQNRKVVNVIFLFWDNVLDFDRFFGSNPKLRRRTGPIWRRQAQQFLILVNLWRSKVKTLEIFDRNSSEFTLFKPVLSHVRPSGFDLKKCQSHFFKVCFFGAHLCFKNVYKVILEKDATNASANNFINNRCTKISDTCTES